MMHRLVYAIAVVGALIGCSKPKPRDQSDDSAATPTPPSFHLSSSAFRADGSIPAQYTCDGANQSPPLAWSGAPQSTKSYVLIVDDPDAPGGTFVHWVVYNIPASVRSLPAGIASGVQVAQFPGARQGQNGFDKTVGYGGPCPPKGAPHHYHFRLFALDQPLEVNAPASRDGVEAALKGHEIGHTQLVALYARR